jgi:hypothetical protein
MRLFHRHRHHSGSKAPRIAISQAEITADLHYPAPRRAAAPESAAIHRSAPR